MADALVATLRSLNPELSTRDKVNIIESYMREQLPVAEIPLKHYFSLGLYAREVTLPAGAMATGKIHKYPQLNILSKGDVSVLLEDGIKRIQAPFTVASPAGTKRIIYAHIESVWTTIHSTHETDLEKIEEHFIAQNEEEYLKFCKILQMEETKCLG